MILFSPQVKSILTAAMLAQIRSDIAMAKTEQAEENLFSARQTDDDADNYDLGIVSEIFTATFGAKLDWLEQSQGIRLKQIIQLNLRHCPANYALILKVITEALQHGPQYCLQCVSASARKFANQASDVQHEVHRMLGFIRFTPMDETTLVAKPKLFHHTADLILRSFEKRYPLYKLVLVLDDCALTIFRHQVSKESAQPYLPYVTDTQTEELWRRYYQSQNIDSRRNIKLAQQRIPQKYWDWLREGAILKQIKQDT